ncbi:MAG: hypothetical protein LC104_07305 [Bacteroidales bacterium]|nr:hypothetical protein [Bacteroidales bacterium]
MKSIVAMPASILFSFAIVAPGLCSDKPPLLLKNSDTTTTWSIIRGTIVGSPGKQTGLPSPVADTVVYVNRDPIEVGPVPKPIDIVINDGKMIPRHAIVLAGQSAVFTISGDEPYALTFHSPAEKAIGRTAPSDPKRQLKRFEKSTPLVTVRCSIHPAFRGYVTVIPGNDRVSTGGMGTYRLETSLPVGKYEVIACHADYGARHQFIEVRSNIHEYLADFDMSKPPSP